MISIFEQLDVILKSVNESEDAESSAEKVVKAIPISPEMETAEQGEQQAREKISKYFYDLSMGSTPGAGLTATDKMELPDTWLDPKMKGKMSGKMEDKEFERNHVIWDQDEEIEKLEKEVTVNTTGEDTEFDDFDYRDNQFGDDADMDDVDMDDLDPSGGSGSGGSSSKSEDEKLRDAIDDAMDSMSDDGLGDDGEDGGQQSGGQQGGQQSGGQQGGSQQGGQQGGQQSGSQQGGSQQGGSQSGNDGYGPDGEPGEGGQEGGKPGEGGQEGGEPGKGGQEGGQEGGHHGPEGGDGEPGGHGSNGGPKSRKDEKLKELKKALDENNKEGVEKSIEDIKSGGDGFGNLAGQEIGDVSDKDIEGDMSKAGVSKEDIEKMSKASAENPMEGMSEEESDKLKKEVVDGLEKKCSKKGGSALAKTIVKHAMKSKLNNDEWKTMLKVFLKSKAVNSGDMAKTKNAIKWGHKNHLWRDSVLPTRGTSHGEIQTIYCFVDFSGSVSQDLVYTFLGRVIDLCAELNYTNINVYGFGQQLVLPREINGRMLKKDGKEVVLSQTWDFINEQQPGWATENFRDVANEIMRIRHKQKDAVYLIFGDGFWQDPEDGPMCLKSICGDRVLDRICVLTYYDPDGWWIEMYRGCIAMLKELVGIKNLICTKVTSIAKDI